MLVRYRMSRNAVVAEPGLTLDEARARLRGRRFRQLPVVEGSKLVGIVTDRDLRGAPPSAKAVREVMTPRPHVIGPDAAIDEAARLLRRFKINALPVLDKGRLVGIITATDVLAAFVELSGAAEPTYRLLITSKGVRGAEDRVREAVRHGGGTLRWLHRDRRQRSRMHLRVKAARIGDVSTALEAAGFEVVSVVASLGRR